MAAFVVLNSVFATMDSEFQRLLLLVLVAGSLIGGIGTVALFYVFRAFGGAKAGGAMHMTLIAGLVSFVLGCCALLFALAYLK